MNRREFLLSLLSVPFGWKALFRKEVKEEIVTSGYVNIEHEEVVEGPTWYMVNDSSPEIISPHAFDGQIDEVHFYHGGGEIGKADGSLFHVLHNMDDWLRDGYVETNKDPYREFAGLDKVINTGWEEKCEDPECPECNGGLPLSDWVADGMRSGTYFEREVEIPLNLPEPVIPGHANISGDDHIAVLFRHENGQCDPETYYVSLCNFIADIIDRDCSHWILPSGECTIDLSGVVAFISCDNGDAFWCPDINVEKTRWYKKVETITRPDELVCTISWELIT